MRSSSIISVLSTPLLLLNLAGNAIASPLIIAERGTCANPCGWGGEYCCSANEACTTSNGQALCVNGGGGGGGWQYYTTTWTATETETTTVVSVWSSSAPATTPAPTGTGTCKYDLGESVCGTICCDATQDCVDGQCVEGSSSAAVTGEPTPGIRPTSNGASTATQTSSPTTTEGFIAPVGTDGADLIGAKATSSHSGLSGGAIAGIVIGVIAGVILLFLLCACLCFKEALDGILAALGFGKRRRRKETTTYEHYSHHSGGSRPRPQGRTWFGTRPNDSEISEKKSSGKGWAYAAVVLGALALCLGLRRRKEEHDDGSTDYTYPSSYYYYSEYGKSILPLQPSIQSN